MSSFFSPSLILADSAPVPVKPRNTWVKLGAVKDEPDGSENVKRKDSVTLPLWLAREMQYQGFLSVHRPGFLSSELRRQYKASATQVDLGSQCCCGMGVSRARGKRLTSVGGGGSSLMANNYDVDFYLTISLVLPLLQQSRGSSRRKHRSLSYSNSHSQSMSTHGEPSISNAERAEEIKRMFIIRSRDILRARGCCSGSSGVMTAKASGGSVLCRGEKNILLRSARAEQAWKRLRKGI